MKKKALFKKSTLRNHTAWICWCILYAISFPTYNQSWTIWFAFIPVLVFAYIRPIRQTVLYAFFYSFPFFGLTLYWLYGFWAPALFIMIPIFSLFYAFFFFCIAFIGRNIKSLRWLIIPAVWVACELLRSTGYHGLLWNLAGDSQYENTLLIQSADIFGVWGITFLIILVNAVLAEIFTHAIEKGSWTAALGKSNAAKLACVSFIFLANLIYGIFQFRHFDHVLRDLPQEKLALLQPNMPSRDEKWWDNIWQYYGIFWELNAEAASHSPDLIVWPETMVKNYVWKYLSEYSPEENFNKFNLRMVNLYKELDTPILFTSPTEKDGKTYNTADYLDPKAAGRQSNSKIHLVPFGEWMPIYKDLPLAKKIIEIEGAGAFTPSSDFNVIQARKSKFRVLVCYEDVFSFLTRIFIRKGVNYFINVTNDGWDYELGLKQPMHQHLAGATMTAISVRRAIARAANTGVSGVILPTGQFEGDIGDYKRGVYVAEVPVMPENVRTGFYHFGFLFPYAMLLVTLVSMAYAVFFIRAKAPEVAVKDSIKPDQRID